MSFRYKIVSSFVAFSLSCVCGLSACGEPAATSDIIGYDTYDGSSGGGNVNYSGTEANNISYEDIARKCKLKKYYVSTKDFKIARYLIETVTGSNSDSNDSDNNDKLSNLVDDFSCIIDFTSPNDPNAKSFVENIKRKIQELDNNGIDVENNRFDKSMPMIAYFGRNFVISTPVIPTFSIPEDLYVFVATQNDYNEMELENPNHNS